MKNVLVSFMLLAILPHPVSYRHTIGAKPPQLTGNVFIITTDGFRWQEVFNGADSILLDDEEYTPDNETIKTLYWHPSVAERRKKLMPFLWNVVAQKGQLYGNRLYDNKVNVANGYAISYPGYSEILTGNDDVSISSNSKLKNPNINILEYLDNKKEFKGKVAAFSSWSLFPYILNQERNGLTINCGYESNTGNSSALQTMVNTISQSASGEKEDIRPDMLTFISAKEYIRQYQPKVFYLGLGETDEFAHDGRYDLYLQQARKVDQMIAELWHWVQTTPGYKDNTTFIITTDHGRGKKPGNWTMHGTLVTGSSQVWLALIGPGIEAYGEIKKSQQWYQCQLAQTIANMLGENFEPHQPTAPAIPLLVNKKAPAKLTGP